LESIPSFEQSRGNSANSAVFNSLLDFCPLKSCLGYSNILISTLFQRIIFVAPMITLSCLSDSKASETVLFEGKTEDKNNTVSYAYAYAVYNSLDNLWGCRAMTPSAHDIEQAVQRLPHISSPRPTARFRRRDERFDQAVLVIAQGLAGTKVPNQGTILGRPHPSLQQGHF
jgi:hypothetical protein